MVERVEENAPLAPVTLPESAAPLVENSARSVGRLNHALILVACIGVPTLGWLMVPVSDGEVAIVGLETHPLPTLCLSRRLGWECPTCGMTRSVIALAHRDVRESMNKHPFGWLVFLLILTQIPYRGYRLLDPDRPLPRLELAGLGSLLTAGLAIVLNHFVRVTGLL